MTLKLFLEAPSGDELSGRDWWVVVHFDWLSEASCEVIDCCRAQKRRKKKSTGIFSRKFFKVWC